MGGGINSNLIKTEYFKNSRNSSKGNPSAIVHFGMPLNKRQASILEKLPKFDTHIILNKKDVSKRDLSVLTVSTGCEFAIFTKESKRIIIRGNKSMVNIDIDKTNK